MYYETNYTYAAYNSKPSQGHHKFVLRLFYCDKPGQHVRVAQAKLYYAMQQGSLLQGYLPGLTEERGLLCFERSDCLRLIAQRYWTHLHHLVVIGLLWQHLVFSLMTDNHPPLLLRL